MISERAFSRLVRRLASLIRADTASRRLAVDALEDIDRERLIQRILSTIRNNSILLCGQPKSGKTEILLALKERLVSVADPNTAFFPVYIDLHGASEDLLFATVADAVLKQLACTSPSQIEKFDADYDHRDLANDLRSIIQTLDQYGAKRARLVLLVDGIDELNSYDPRTTQRVRSLFMTNLAENLVMVASAVTIDKRWEQEGSPWYNFFEEIELVPAHVNRSAQDRMPCDA